MCSKVVQSQGVQASRKETYLGVRRINERRRMAPRWRALQTHAGFSYIGVLLAVAIVGIAMTGANRYWSTLIQRERETELLHRGHRIREAIRSYYENPPAGQRRQYPLTIKELLKDPRYPQARRHLRQWYPDPMTGNVDWVLIRDAAGRIKGVHSAHQGRPIKTGGFAEDYQSFETAVAYTDWKFVYVPRK